MAAHRIIWATFSRVCWLVTSFWQTDEQLGSVQARSRSCFWYVPGIAGGDIFRPGPRTRGVLCSVCGKDRDAAKAAGGGKYATYHAFVKLLDVEVKRSLDIVRLNKKAQGYVSMHGTRFGWDDVVCVCRDVMSGSQLAPAPTPAPKAPPARSAPAPRAPPPRPALAPKAAPAAPMAPARVGVAANNLAPAAAPA